MFYLIKYILFVLVISFNQLAAAEDLLVTKKAWDQSSYSYPNKGELEITVARNILKENEQTPEHCHPVPVFSYFLKGTIEVETSDGKTQTFKEGDVMAEPMSIVHRGKAIGGDAVLLVFLAGSTEIPHTVLKEDSEDYKAHCEQ